MPRIELDLPIEDHVAAEVERLRKRVAELEAILKVSKMREEAHRDLVQRCTRLIDHIEDDLDMIKRPDDW